MVSWKPAAKRVPRRIDTPNGRSPWCATEDGQAARAAAQPLVTAILDRLMGWRPSTAHMELRLVECPRPDFQGGLLWLPLVFETNQAV
ncbi:MAG: hypothetical protein AB1443_09855 [Pseudomonadota bacterium]